MRERTICRGFGRTAATAGLAALASLAAVVGPGPAGQATASAAPTGPAAPGQAADRYIDDGKASGRANVLSLAPSAGALQLALGAGEVIAETSGGLSQASSKAANLGLIGSTLTAENCSGRDGVLTPEQLPQALVVDNRNGPTSADAAEAPGPVPGTSGGHKEVVASDTPSSLARVTFLDAEIPGVLSVAGGEATAEAEVFPGEGREGRAAVDVDVDLFGAVQLRGLHWEARHRTPGTDDAEASFSIDALEIAGVPIPVESVEQAAAVINTALATIGLVVEMPTVVRVDEGSVDFVRVTPLRIMLAESPVGQVLVRPALEATREARSQLFTVLSKEVCELAGAFLVGDIGLGVLAGSGSLVASIGGAEASSATVVVEDLFPDIGPATPSDSGVAPPVVGGAPVPSGPSRPVVATPALTPAPVPAATVSSPGAFDQICENVHPNRKPSCSEGAAAAAGLAGLAATAAVGVLDLRRRRKLFPATDLAGAAS